MNLKSPVGMTASTSGKTGIVTFFAPPLAGPKPSSSVGAGPDGIAAAKAGVKQENGVIWGLRG